MYKICMRKTRKLLTKEIREKLNKWRDSPCLWIGRFNIVKMSVLFNLFYRFKVIPINIPASYFVNMTNRVWIIQNLELLLSRSNVSFSPVTDPSWALNSSPDLYLTLISSSSPGSNPTSGLILALNTFNVWLR